MAIYFLTFILSSLLFAIGGAERSRNTSKSSLSICWIIDVVAVALPCVLAGARDYGVGTDTTTYGQWLFEVADSSSNFSAYLAEVNAGIWDVGLTFSLQAYLSTSIFHSQFWYYFLIELLIIVPIYISIRQHCSNHLIGLTMFLYFLVFYIPGLNLMRQMIAVSFSTLAVSMLVRDKLAYYWICSLLGIMFHTTAAIVLVVFAIVAAMRKRSGSIKVVRKNAKLIGAIVAIIAIFCVLNLQTVMSAISWISDSFDYYSRYANHSEGEMGNAYYIFISILLVGILLLIKYNKLFNDFNCILLTCIIAFSAILYSMGSYLEAVSRMSYYGLAPMVLILAIVFNNYKNRLVLNSGLILVFVACVIQFSWVYVAQGSHEAIPYTSQLLGIE